MGIKKQKCSLKIFYKGRVCFSFHRSNPGLIVRLRVRNYTFVGLNRTPLKPKQGTHCYLYSVWVKARTRNTKQKSKYDFSDSWFRAWVTGERLDEEQKCSRRKVWAKVPGRGLDEQIACAQWLRGRSKLAFLAQAVSVAGIRTSHPDPHPRSQMESHPISGHTFEHCQHMGICDKNFIV